MTSWLDAGYPTTISGQRTSNTSSCIASNGRIVASAGLEPLGTFGLLRSLAVAPELRGNRLSDALWSRSLDEARRRGIRHLYLLTTTAEGLFLKWGFRPAARNEVPEVIRQTSEYSSVCPSTATVMLIDVPADGD